MSFYNLIKFALKEKMICHKLISSIKNILSTSVLMISVYIQIILAYLSQTHLCVRYANKLYMSVSVIFEPFEILGTELSVSVLQVRIPNGFGYPLFAPAVQNPGFCGSENALQW